MRSDELGAVVLERVAVGAGRAQRLACEDEIGDAPDQVFDTRAIRMETHRDRWPQRGAHRLSVIGWSQEMIKRGKKFSKTLLS